MKTSSTYNNVSAAIIARLPKFEYIHVAADGVDFHFDVIRGEFKAARNGAFSKKDELIKGGQTNIRIWHAREFTDHRDNMLEQHSEECLFEIGKLPK